MAARARRVALRRLRRDAACQLRAWPIPVEPCGRFHLVRWSGGPWCTPALVRVRIRAPARSAALGAPVISAVGYSETFAIVAVLMICLSAMTVAFFRERRYPAYA